MFKQIKRWWGRPRNPAGHVYYARLCTPQGTFYKIGYTSKHSLAERLAYENCGDEKLIEREFFFTYREDAWDVEQDLLDHFDSQRAFGKFSNDPAMPLYGRGQSEIFRNDVLGCDEHLYRLPDAQPLSTAEKAVHEEQTLGCFLMGAALVAAPFTFGISLVLALFGGFAFFGSGSGKRARPSTAKRPIHPPKIQTLVSELSAPK